MTAAALDILPDIEIRLAPQGDVLEAYMLSWARVNFIRGPLGSGKTFQSCQKLFKAMCNQAPDANNVRKSRAVAVRNTYSDLLTTTIKDWKDLFGELGRYKGPGAEPPTHLLSFDLDDGTTVESEVVFLALDRPDHVKKLRGIQATFFWLNEVKELDKSIVDMCDGRHGRYPSAMDGGPTWHGMIGDTNSPDDDHWYYKLAEELKNDPDGGLEEWEFFSQPGGVIYNKATGHWEENPQAENLNNLPHGYYIKMIAGKAEDWIKVNLGNQYGSVQTGKPIYKGQWNDSLHVSRFELLPFKKRELFIGMDFGLMPCAAIGQLTPRGQLRILEELVGLDMGVRQFAENVLIPTLNTKYHDLEYLIIGDPAGDQRSPNNETTVFDELGDLELNVTGSPDKSNSTSRRWEAVRYYLSQLRDGQPTLLLSPTCKVLRKGFNGGYQLRRLQVAGEARYTTIADKNIFSHIHDALQYLCVYLRHGYESIKNNKSKAHQRGQRSY